MIIKLLYTIFVISMLFTHASAVEIDEIREFLAEDTTDNRNYTKCHTCGHFARELAKNATDHNLSIGSTMIGYRPDFSGFRNHGMNYFEMDGIIYFIEPQTDEILTASDIHMMNYNYARFWEDGTMMPTQFRGNRAHDYKFEEHLNDTLPGDVINSIGSIAAVIITTDNSSKDNSTALDNFTTLDTLTEEDPQGSISVGVIFILYILTFYLTGVTRHD